MVVGSTMQHDERRCNADAPVAMAKPWATARMHRELRYGCSSGSGKAMGSSTGCNSAKDDGQQA